MLLTLLRVKWKITALNHFHTTRCSESGNVPMFRCINASVCYGMEATTTDIKLRSQFNWVSLCWPLINDHWSLTTDHWSMATGHWPLVSIDQLSMSHQWTVAEPKVPRYNQSVAQCDHHWWWAMIYELHSSADIVTSHIWPLGLLI